MFWQSDLSVALYPKLLPSPPLPADAHIATVDLRPPWQVACCAAARLPLPVPVSRLCLCLCPCPCPCPCLCRCEPSVSESLCLTRPIQRLRLCARARGARVWFRVEGLGGAPAVRHRAAHMPRPPSPTPHASCLMPHASCLTPLLWAHPRDRVPCATFALHDMCRAPQMVLQAAS